MAFELNKKKEYWVEDPNTGGVYCILFPDEESRQRVKELATVYVDGVPKFDEKLFALEWFIDRLHDWKKLVRDGKPIKCDRKNKEWFYKEWDQPSLWVLNTINAIGQGVHNIEKAELGNLSATSSSEPTA